MPHPSTSPGLTRLVACILLLPALGGCARWFERAPLYPGAGEVGRIEVPNGLTRPVSDPSLSVPPGERGVLERKDVLPPDWTDGEQ
ncbi:MAG: hypothetical protein MUE46_15815 [Xanthomonadales bacterium]|nr:hypothetical protein [Xanthomonadales bacterium]